VLYEIFPSTGGEAVKVDRVRDEVGKRCTPFVTEASSRRNKCVEQLADFKIPKFGHRTPEPERFSYYAEDLLGGKIAAVGHPCEDIQEQRTYPLLARVQGA
jgi:hypothetical protein